MAQKIDGRKNNGGKPKLDDVVLEKVYSLMPAYKQAKESGDSNRVSQIEELMTQGNTLFEGASMDAYYPIYRSMVDGTRITATHKGNQIIEFFLKKIRRDFSSDIYRTALVHYHEYLTTGENAKKPLLEYRERGKEYAGELGLELDFEYKGELRKSKRIRKSEIKSDEFMENEEDIIKKEEVSKTYLEYFVAVSDLIINSPSEAPKARSVQDENVDLNKEYKGTNSISADEAALKEKNKKIKGNRGEKIAIRIEMERLSSIGHPELIPCIKHIAKNKDGYGYDIESVSVDEKGNIFPIFIEVKATAGEKDMPFYISSRELLQSKIKGDQYFIYRIYNMTEKTDSIDYYVLQGDLEKYFEVKPTAYVVKTK